MASYVSDRPGLNGFNGFNGFKGHASLYEASHLSCLKCGKSMLMDSLFCRHCGTKRGEANFEPSYHLASNRGATGALPTSSLPLEDQPTGCAMYGHTAFTAFPRQAVLSVNPFEKAAWQAIPQGIFCDRKEAMALPPMTSVGILLLDQATPTQVGPCLMDRHQASPEFNRAEGTPTAMVLHYTKRGCRRYNAMEAWEIAISIQVLDEVSVAALLAASQLRTQVLGPRCSQSRRDLSLQMLKCWVSLEAALSKTKVLRVLRGPVSRNRCRSLPTHPRLPWQQVPGRKRMLSPGVRWRQGRRRKRTACAAELWSLKPAFTKSGRLVDERNDFVL